MLHGPTLMSPQTYAALARGEMPPDFVFPPDQSAGRSSLWTGTRDVMGSIEPVVSHKPLRIQVFSDLHLDLYAADVPPLAPDADVVVVAGDVCADPALGFARLRRVIPETVPIVAVAGTREFYDGDLSERTAMARRMCQAFEISFLEDDYIVIDGVRFIGSTLWTDYLLYRDREAAIAFAGDSISAHRRIYAGAFPQDRFLPEDALRLHEASRDFISRTLATSHDGPTVVVTHHAPHPASIHTYHLGDPLNAAFASDLSQILKSGRPPLWIHGRVHASLDYVVESTRVVCNSRGHGNENEDFDPSFIVEVSQ